MKLFKFILLITLHIGLCLQAQPLFNEVYDYGLDLTESAYSITEYEQHYFVGGAHNYGFGNSSSTFLKVDAAGQMVFFNKYDFSPGNEYIQSSVISNSKLYCIGASVDTTENLNIGYNSFILKIDPNTGDSLFYKEIDFGYYDNPRDILSYRDGFLLLGYIYNNLSLDYCYTYISHIDTLGNVIYYEEFGDGLGYHFAYDFKRTRDGGFIIGGDTDDYPINNQDQLWLMKLDSNLNQLWYFEYGDTTTNESVRIYNYLEETLEGDFIIGAEDNVNDKGLLFKIDSYGNHIWTKDISFAEYTNVKSIKVKDDKIIVAGGVAYYDSIPPEFENPRGYICKYTSDGETLIWQRYFSKWWGNPSNHDYIHDMVLTSDGGILVSGYEIHALQTWNDAWLIKFDSCGFTVGAEPNALLVIDSIVGNQLFLSNLSDSYCTGKLNISIVNPSTGDTSAIDSSHIYAYSEWTNGNDPSQLVYALPDTGTFVFTLTTFAGDGIDTFTTTVSVSDTSTNLNNRLRTTLPFDVYPNPSNDFVVIQLNNSSTDLNGNIVDLNGRIAHTFEIPSNILQEKISLPELSNGIYILNLWDNQGNRGIQKLSIVQ